MENKKRVIIILLVIVIVLGGAYVLYDNLGDRMELNQLVVQNNIPSEPQSATAATTQSEAQDETESTEPEETQSESSPESQFPPAPDFVVFDEEGNEVRLSDYIGKPIVLNFWASWCPPCKMEMPDFQEKYLEFGDEVQFLMINMTDGSRETVASASEFTQKQEYTFPVFYDKKVDAAMPYGAYSLPTTFFIDADGYVIAQATGALSGENLQQGIEMIYSGK